MDEGAEFADLDEEGLRPAFAEATFGAGLFVFRQRLEADRDPHAVIKLAKESDRFVIPYAQDLREVFALRKCAIEIGETRHGHKKRMLAIPTPLTSRIKALFAS